MMRMLDRYMMGILGHGQATVAPHVVVTYSVLRLHTNAHHMQLQQYTCINSLAAASGVQLKYSMHI